MSDGTTIEWTEATWNPVRGCKKVSPGCKHCYAETFAERFRGVPGHPYENGFDLRLAPHKLFEPLTWPGPRTVFVNSMSDLFQPEIPTDYFAMTLQVMEQSPWNTYQVLTKRADRMQELLTSQYSSRVPTENIWWGVSVEDRRYGLPRIEQLRHTPAAVRFLSVEPLLEELGPLELDGIHWVIVGGESGPGARPMQAEWVDSVREQCEGTGVPFFFKQWGGIRKSLTGRTLHGRTYDDMPDRSRRQPIPDKASRVGLTQELQRTFSEQLDRLHSLEITIGQAKGLKAIR